MYGVALCKGVLTIGLELAVVALFLLFLTLVA